VSTRYRVLNLSDNNGEGSQLKHDEDAGMRITTRRTALGVLAAAGAAPRLALAQESAPSIKGVIILREGNQLVLRTGTGETRVRILDTTKIESTAGVLGMRRQDRLPTELIPGLPIEVSGTMQGPELVASSITFKPDDLKTAQQIQAGIHGTQQQLASVGELAPVGRASVYFAVGSATITAQGKQDLRDIAAKAKTYRGARLAIVGRADPTGNAEANQRLSERRAAAVRAYLIQSAGVLPGAILPSEAVGETPIFEDPNPPRSDAEARRVTVTVAVSKATLPPSQ
jgi:outer membrane protein OmpA-like peptidoglycan-associated protein